MLDADPTHTAGETPEVGGRDAEAAASKLEEVGGAPVKAQ